MLEAAPLIPLLLPLPISLDDPRVSLSALLLVVRMFIPPLLLAFANDLAIPRHRRPASCGGSRLVAGADRPAGYRPPAGVGRSKGQRDVDSEDSSGACSNRLLRTGISEENRNGGRKARFRNYCRVRTASPPTGALSGWLTGPGLLRRKWLRFSPARTPEMFSALQTLR